QILDTGPKTPAAGAGTMEASSKRDPPPRVERTQTTDVQGRSGPSRGALASLQQRRDAGAPPAAGAARAGGGAAAAAPRPEGRRESLSNPLASRRGMGRRDLRRRL